MKIEEIGIRASNQFPEMVCDYLEGDPFLRPFYVHPPVIDAYADAIKIKSHFSADKRRILTEELLKTYERFGVMLDDSSVVKQNIRQLKNNNTFTITTGHQLCLLGGPMYVHFKIQSAIKLAAQLKQAYPDYHFVPVFWMASEDHDFEEVNHINLFGRRFTWNTNSGEMPVGRVGLNGIESVLQELIAFAGNENQKQFLEQCTHSYLTSENLAQATLKFIHDSYKDYGLVIIEPDNKAFKQQFSTHVKMDLTEQRNHALLQETNQAIKQKYKPQVNGRQINLFYITETGRKRIRFENNRYEIGEQYKFLSSEELIKEVDEFPERFSPNVVLRPLFQECILPNLAYVGGPGELSYWLQLKTIFDYNQIPMPVLHLRESYIMAGKALTGKLSKLGLTVKDLLQPETMLTEHFIQIRSSNPGIKPIADELTHQMQLLIDQVKAADAGLGSELIQWKSTQTKYLQELTKKMNQLRKQRLSDETDKILKLRQTLLPDGALAERKESFIGLQLHAQLNMIEMFLAMPYLWQPAIRLCIEE